MPLMVEVTARKMRGRLMSFRTLKKSSDTTVAPWSRRGMCSHPVRMPRMIEEKSSIGPRKRLI
ncbi:MAG: hypothetical protein S4CHLAM81_03000 [Chlamydiales bacterium]|nr:hypothetical protein [Chlamydiales bacterium]MCH9635090.1 hypothetical protein [Chlamydiales bacterium]